MCARESAGRQAGEQAGRSHSAEGRGVMMLCLRVLLLLHFIVSLQGYQTCARHLYAGNLSISSVRKGEKHSTVLMSSRRSMSPQLHDAFSATYFNKKVKFIVKLTLFYLISAFYNIHNKKALNILKMPYTVATIQMVMGSFIFVPLWLFNIRERPFNKKSDMVELAGFLRDVTFYNVLTHSAGVIALGAGAVSFTQVVKASEPIFTALIGYFFTNERLPFQAYFSLLPIFIGVSLSSLNELNFTWYCLLVGLICNLFSALRTVYSKKAMCNDVKCVDKLSPENYYSLLTLFSSVLLVPVMVITEYSKINAALSNPGVYIEGWKYALSSGLLYYLYNEVSFRVLDDVTSPITHAVCNVLKRVIIIISSVIIFQNPITFQGRLGAGISIAGVLLYSLMLKMK